MRLLREECGLSLRSLERRTLSSKSKLHKIETGITTPSLETAQLIDEALNARGELVAMVRHDAASVLPRREFLGVAAGAAAAPAARHLPSGRRVDSTVPDQLLLETARLRRLDDFMGGADTYRVFAGEVSSTALLLREGSYQEATGRRLLVVLAEQAQLAGWAAFDAGWHTEAHALFDLSLQAARDADHKALAGNAMAFVGYQQLALGQSAVDDLTTATDTAGGDATPTVRALLHCRRAWAHANEGQPDDAQRHLDIAQAALREPSDQPEPDWVYWVDDMEHEIMTGRCWTALRRPTRAIGPLERVMAAYEDTHGRDKALYLSFLADAYLDANELEQACQVTSRAMDLSAGVGSIRPRTRIESVIRRVDGSARCVVELRAKAAEWVSLR
jgi:transcriptional regulator with XRE-family HTH domain